jgi:hypothetical protein
MWTDLDAGSSKKFALGFVGAAMFIATPLTAPSVASADPGGGEVWKCWHTMETRTIPRSEYWSCVEGTIHRISTYDGRLLAKYDGNCANGVWQDDRSAAWVDVISYCPPDGRPRS